MAENCLLSFKEAIAKVNKDGEGADLSATRKANKDMRKLMVDELIDKKDLDRFIKGLTDEEFAKLRDDTMGEVLKKINQIERNVTLKDKFTKYISQAKTVKGIHNMVKELVEYANYAGKQAAKEQETMLNRAMREELEGLDPNLKKNVERLTVSAVMGTDALPEYIKKIKGPETDANFEIAKALEQGHHPDIKELNIIAKVWKRYEKMSDGFFDTRGIGMFRKNKTLIPLRGAVRKLAEKSEEEFVEHLIEKINFDSVPAIKFMPPDKKLEKSKELLKALYRDVRVGNTASANLRAFETYGVFKDFDAQYVFLNEYGNLSTDILGDAFRVRHRAAYEIGSSDVIGTNLKESRTAIMGGIEAGIKENAKFKKLIEDGKLDVSELKKAMENYTSVFEPQVTGGAGADLQNVLSGVGAFISGTLTGRSVLRNLLGDTTFIAALSANAFAKNGVFMTAMSDIGAQFISIINRSGVKAGRGFLEELGFEMAQSQVDLLSGATMQATRAQPKGGRFSKKIKKYGQAVGEFNDTINFAGLMHSVTEQRYYRRYGRVFLKTFQNPDQMTGAMRRQLQLFDIGDAEIALFKNLDTIKWQGQEIMHDFRKVMELPDEKIAIVRRPGETMQATRTRLMNSYRAALQSTVDETLAKPTLKDNLSPGAKTTGFASIVSAQAAKFLPITMRQKDNILKGFLRAVDLDPHDVDTVGFIQAAYKNPMVFGMYTTKLALTGIAMNWVIDLANGRDPEPISAKSVLAGLSTSGMLGWLSVAHTNLRFNDQIIGAGPVSAYVPVGKAWYDAAAELDADKTKKAIAKTSQRFFIPLNTAYTARAHDWLLRKGLGWLPERD